MNRPPPTRTASTHKSYLTSRNRPSTGSHENADHVKDSLMKFLDDAQDEDLIFSACSPSAVRATTSSKRNSTNNNNRRRNGAAGSLSSASAHVSLTLPSLAASKTTGDCDNKNDDADDDYGFGRVGSPLFKSPSAAASTTKKSPNRLHTAPLPGGLLGSRSDHVSKSIDISPLIQDGNNNKDDNERSIPFDRKTKAHKRTSKTDPKNKKKTGSSSTSKTKKKGRKGHHHDDHSTDDDDDSDLQSFALSDDEGSLDLGFDFGGDDDDDDDVSLSSVSDDDDGAPKQRRLSKSKDGSSSSLGRLHTSKRSGSRHSRHSSSSGGEPRRGISRNNSSVSSTMGGGVGGSGRHSGRAPRRTQSYTDAQNNNSMSSVGTTRKRSSSRGRLARSASARGTSPGRLSSAAGRKAPSRASSLTANLGNLDRQARRERMKNGYRSAPSGDARSVGKYNKGDNGDGSDGENSDGLSVSSGKSQFSTRSAMTTRRSGLEGGALNAFMSVTQAQPGRNGGGGGRRPSITMMNSGSGASVMSAPPDEDFIQLRKERQDRILDVALKERYSKGDEEEDEQPQSLMIDVEDEDGDSDSDNSLNFGKKKKKGLIGRMQRAAKKTAKVSKSGAKGTVNVVKDPKRAAMKAGKFAKSVGTETGKMVLDPTLAAKKGVKGIKGTAKLTTKMTKQVGKGTLNIAKTGLDVTSLVLDSTIDGTTTLVNGATGLIIKKKDDDGRIVYDDYDPSMIQGRQRDSSIIGRFASAEISDEGGGIARDKSMRRLSRQPVNTPTVLAPSVQAGSSGVGG
eukprot:CAMPEP_0113513174 /NCGR_PEP_ID=MMETSP0014_2-20120614/39716_1 /TAXON_ID=2857 /ORGANISM="Nitzschia sp." /LENGTH=789 /DNA_ID=CAMNT_0000409549 /DNA_START=74 /DNA_END=2439 /DNA_ORIENTATION=+ /assembly_acc=CAM_ASM_000159